MLPVLVNAAVAPCTCQHCSTPHLVPGPDVQRALGALGRHQVVAPQQAQAVDGRRVALVAGQLRGGGQVPARGGRGGECWGVRGVVPGEPAAAWRGRAYADGQQRAHAVCCKLTRRRCCPPHWTPPAALGGPWRGRWCAMCSNRSACCQHQLGRSATRRPTSLHGGNGVLERTKNAGSLLRA